MTSAPIRITRRALGQDAGGSLEQTLGERVGSRDLAQRMMAARQIASLVRMAQPTSAAATQAAADQAAPQAASGQGWPVELARGVMSDPSPAVRAELPAALVTSPLDAQVLAVLRPAVADPSPLVRLRMAELIGQGSADERPSLLRELGQDADPLVALMARAFQGR